ncbi:DEAD/DEAH box helicase [Sorangium sp. So ce385]|uniref:DEAD/DEAH box helicase n=1 Tax=Sorangium sp. So ce385 TaxID=3133308 RepID=UPI003F5B60EB
MPQVATLFAQAHAKYVLHEVREATENFPNFDPNLDDKVTFLVYALLAAGCSIIEQGDRSEGSAAVERAASLLHYVHGPIARESRESGFHALVASMAFYAAGHYSRAFVTIRPIEEQTAAARTIAAFLRKDVASLINQLNGVLLRDPVQFEDQLDLDEWAITIAISRAAAVALEFIFTGVSTALAYADQQLEDAAIIASCGNYAAWWWIIRLFRLMLKDLGDSSPWKVLPPYFGPQLSDALSRYIGLLAFAKHPIAELWSSQRTALPLALDSNNGGGIINLRTSAGKTRVAELAILQTLINDPAARILYLAPFRSLAIEVEHTLAATFSWLGHGVSHLYGGSRVSSVDTELAAESAITIATPEKARALSRAAPNIFENMKLIIIDEGHLIGASERFVRNEVFVEHLRALVRATGARLLLLSAVLPNPQELAEWVTGDRAAVAISQWKPSAERFGMLRWNGSCVRIDWHGDTASFNPSFVEAKPLGFGRRRKPFPSNKSEAVAATAVRLSAIGPVMIFTGRAVSVPTLAEAVLVALGETPADHPWPQHEWQVFQAICREELDSDALELRAARAGVVCHSNRLTPQVRLAMEHLMRSKPPKIIVATTTLAQGVNVGVSSVIVYTPYIGDKSTIDKRDFWNICGRAGRAFVDGEGKILYAIDDTRERWQIKKDESLARSYFGAGVGDRVESGLLFVVQLLRRIAGQAGVSFEVLLELAASNDFSSLGSESKAIEEICDLLDDELLALHADPVVNGEASEPEVWVEQVFRNSLAALQARAGTSEAGTEDVLAFLRARATSALRRVPQRARKAVVSSGLPMSVALRAHQSTEVFSAIATSYDADSQALPELASAVRAIEEWARTYARPVTGAMPEAAKLDSIREGWLGGIGLQTLSTIEPDVRIISKELYGWKLPWIIHAASQQLRGVEESGKAETLARLALLVELGVPSELAARIFLAGVRSRAAATELAAVDLAWGSTVSEIGRKLRNAKLVESIRPLVSTETADWLELMVADAARQRRQTLPTFPEFKLVGTEDAELLHARRLNDRILLATAEGVTRIPVRATAQLPFDKVANDPRVAFAKSDGVWRMIVRDPRLEPEEELW